MAKHYDLRISAFYGLSGAPLYWEDGVMVLPGIDGTFGNEVLLPHSEDFFGSPRGGLVVTLMDVWVLNPAICQRLNMACWVPVDHEPAPPQVIEFLRLSGAVPIAMSRFGQEQLAEFDPLYVPHGVDTEVFKPIPKAEARAKLGVPEDAFVVGIVAANKGNPSRKSFSESLQAFAALRRKHSNAYLYLHTEISGSLGGGVPLHDVIPACGIPDEAIRVVDQYRVSHRPPGADSMARMYSAMDVLLNPATGEGFGIPVLEANACGTPAIVTDFSAMSEVCGAGWKVSGTSVWTSQRSWQCTPNLEEISASLEECYRLSEADRTALSEKAVKHAAQYDADTVMTEHMLPALEAVEGRIAAREPRVLKAAA